MKMLFRLSDRLGPLAMLFVLSMAAQAQTSAEVWVRRYNSPDACSVDLARKIVTDPDGNVIVGGGSIDDITGVDILLIKYSGAGVPLWTNRYNGSHNTPDNFSNLAVDRQGNIFVTEQGYVTIAYSPAGVPLWTNSYRGPDNSHAVNTGLAVDHNGNVFVTGYYHSEESANDYATIAYSGAGVPLWTNRYDGGNSDDQATAVAVDGSGNVFVTGSSGHYVPESSGPDYATIAYSGAGVPLWTNRYDGPSNALFASDYAIGVTVDNIGNVFVTGSSLVPGDDDYYATIAYSPGGVPLWTNRYSGLSNSYSLASAIAVDHHGNVFVTGYSSTNYDTIAYSGAGVALWTNQYAGGRGRSYAIAVDGDGNVVVTGASGDDYATIKYSGAGVALWTNRYGGPADSPDQAYSVSVDSSGNVFVTGRSQGDYATIAYSAAGVALWTNYYNGPANTPDEASALALDHTTGNVLVTGTSATELPSVPSDYVTIAYSEEGIALWTNRYNGSANSIDAAKAMAVDSRGNVFVTGHSSGIQDPGYSDYATIAYTASGAALWTNRYNRRFNSADLATAVAVDGSGNVFVTGYSDGTDDSGTDYDYATVAYSPAGGPLWTNRYSGPVNSQDRAVALAVDQRGNVFVTGSSDGGESNYDYATIAYSGAGVPFWTNRYTGLGDSFDQASGIAVCGQGNVFVTGSSGSASGGSYATIAYSPAGVPLWTNYYDGPRNGFDGAMAIAVDHTGNVFVTGSQGGDYATVAYSGTGVALWTNRANGTGYEESKANKVAVDHHGNVFVTAFSRGASGGSYDYVTIAYTGSGVPFWTNRYNGPANGPDVPSSLAVGRDGAVYVTGTSDGHYGSQAIYDYATIKYIWRPYLAMEPFTAGSATANLTLTAPPGSSWSILRASVITGPWTDLGVSLTTTNGSAQFTDPSPLANGAFYRVAPP